MEKKTAILMLQDGTTYKGTAIGAIGTTTGEICFNTSMTGYQEIYTDPSYYGQIIVNTVSHIGNYGTVHNENESKKPQINGLVVKSFSSVYSRSTAEGSLQDYLESANLVGIADIDTRALVRHIRQKGAMNAIITSETEDLKVIKKQLDATPNMEGLELSSVVTTKEPYIVGDPRAAVKVAVLDLGIKKSILENFTSRGMLCKVFPSNTTFEQMKQWKPDGYFLSNGPGDPSVMDYAVDTAKQILDADKPLFGICLGHQIISRAMGLETYKMHHGHRGANHPVKNLVSGRSEVTSQNHGFAVSMESIEKNDAIELTHINLNDETVEGIKVLGKNAFSVQYHPEASPGPNDSRYLFTRFLEMIQENN
ncbi:glutamine-hydrolyzing carbamoyl-phosphate synthase small subunit [Flammeovirga yaeyamensis]|uniref:Carbamoyl phosphate synthase small chain n=1 Tax=Flammeovirga yaeyamensis TaxID=367791 RepID=A0AAX1N268_9BACT|nr:MULTISPECIES: glutamine-hydrolyzing carbamoyl-phosphate synthase small subunit [Flammeovirga]ANQ51015.1 glutamine-hydrolyzing carbamoyl-phosphate synthase small subunit [Flammeovirga sp. MY04]MBB3701108.1 carbamoyl-phosphate synthase small subunit [Flammeovirga yaeyamensis]NMF38425.1 glutamine-hydrolyzing carbamoyl-phosphate synthase small subunit [Flammeovirga yaeyamensis]QWG01575.1 glutamine-hydrolyzing carbamoyl-phosphate synthase small subunit [Flammeovirga yaeyamensis]